MTACWSSRKAVAMPMRGRQSAGSELVEPVGQWCGIVGVEHAGELADQAVGVAEFRAVYEEPM